MTRVEQDILDLQARVRELEDQVRFLIKTSNSAYSPPDRANSIDPRIVEALRQGDKLLAIKIYRELTGKGLAEAKTAIDALAAALA